MHRWRSWTFLTVLILITGLLAVLTARSDAATIADRLASGGTAVEVTSEPSGTTLLHFAVMQNVNGTGVKYVNRPAAERVFTPPAGTPVVDVQAYGANGALGGWAGRLQTGDELAKLEAERATAETLAGRLAGELAATEALITGLTGRIERVAEEARETPEEPPKEEPAGSMVVAVDTGGWTGSLFTELLAGGVNEYRVHASAASAVNAQAPGHVASVIFGEGGNIEAISPAAYSSEVAAGAARTHPVAVEVLNEPGGSWFWSDADTPGSYVAYAQLAKATRAALATVTPRPVVLCSWDGGQDGNSTFGQGIRAAGALAYCDGVTVHPYGGSAGQDGGAGGNRAMVERAHTESGLPVYITEIGWPTATGQPATGDSQQWTEGQQAANIASFITWARATGFVRMVVIFNAVDYGTNAFYGIETAARKHKQSFAALAAASK